MAALGSCVWPGTAGIGILVMQVAAILLLGATEVSTVAADLTRGNHCPPGRLQCPNSKKCILEESRCDGTADCGDSPEDEIDCTVCSERAFLCDGFCMRLSFRCDGEIDCNDNMDEEGCESTDDVFYCNDTNQRKAINKVGVCDGVDDCCSLDNCSGADETNCQNKNCSSGSYKHDDNCYLNTMICDGVQDFEGYAHKQWDEVGCLKCEHHLYDVTFDQTKICDGVKDCDDGKDERHCPCDANWHKCESLDICMQRMDMCDGRCPGQDVRCNPELYGVRVSMTTRGFFGWFSKKSHVQEEVAGGNSEGHFQREKEEDETTTHHQRVARSRSGRLRETSKQRKALTYDTFVSPQYATNLSPVQPSSSMTFGRRELTARENERLNNSFQWLKKSSNPCDDKMHHETDEMDKPHTSIFHADQGPTK